MPDTKNQMTSADASRIQSATVGIDTELQTPENND